VLREGVEVGVVEVEVVGVRMCSDKLIQSKSTEMQSIL